jgi:hypothetical protein
MPFFMQPAITKTASGVDFYETNVDNVVQSVTAGTGISVTGTSTAPVVNNSGVISLTAGDGISVTGTVSDPTIATASILGTPSMSLKGSRSGTATGVTSVPIGDAIETVSGGVYAFSGGQVGIEAEVAGSDFGFDVFVNNGANDVKFITDNTARYKPGGSLRQQNIPLPGVIFVAQGTSVVFALANTAGAGVNDTVQASIFFPTLVRIR